MGEGAVVVRVVEEGLGVFFGGRSVGAVGHGFVVVAGGGIVDGGGSGGAIVGGGGGFGTGRIEEFGAAGVGGDHADFVGVVEGEVRVDEDEEVGDGGGEGEGRGEKSPGVRVGVEDDG